MHTVGHERTPIFPQEKDFLCMGGGLVTDPTAHG